MQMMTTPQTARAFLPLLHRSGSNGFGSLQREFNRLFDELGGGWETFAEARVAPHMDVIDTKDGVEVDVELPGLRREDIKIAIDGDVLTVSGEKKAESQTQDRNYRVVERAYGEFSRSIYLPRSIDTSKINAVMTDGVLKITAPKRPEAQTKTIEIQSA
jgi:HSP20 family protein